MKKLCAGVSEGGRLSIMAALSLLFLCFQFAPSRANILFVDDFNDNAKDFSKWTESFTAGTWQEMNQRTEFQLQESGTGERFEGIQGSAFQVTLSASQGVVVSCDMISDIGSTGWVGYLHLEVTDGTNWIRASYRKGTDDLQYEDSQSGLVLIGNRPDGTWDNEILVFSDKYSVRMDTATSGWVQHTVFQPNSQLMVRIYIQVGGSTPSYYQRSGFDNVLAVPVTIPSPRVCGDVNCDLTVDISDAVYLIAYIFGGGSAPCAGCK